MTSKTEHPAHAEEVYSTPKKGGLVNKLYPPGPQPGAKGRVKNHCRKFWWCDCLVLIIIVLVVILPIIYVAIPNIAQKEINKSTLEVTAQEVTNPQPDGIHLKLESLIKSDSKFHPEISGFEASLTLKGASTPFIKINIPDAKSEKETRVTVDQDVKLDNKTAFIEYTKAVMGSDTFEVELNGKTKLHLKGLPGMDVNYNKVVSMKGLNHLQGLNISDIKILSGANEILSDGSNMVGKVLIPNPSVMTLDLGNLTMNLAVDGKAIGTSLLPNLVLKPGNFSYPMQSRVNQLDVLSLVQSKYKNAVLPLEITGNASTRNGQALDYYSEAIRSNKIQLNLNIADALKGIGINITSSGH